MNQVSRTPFDCEAISLPPLANIVSPEGKVQWGQLVDSKPNPVLRESTHEYVTGAFLLAASEVYKLSPK